MSQTNLGPTDCSIRAGAVGRANPGPSDCSIRESAMSRTIHKLSTYVTTEGPNR
ncbi:hypothetical protein [Halorhabdus rudnickae]|uniref:hypothetical protein n=1 Tax=Halorhabdus rudnickae TaxID=1775544 RepID=UPI00143844E2|nr:hypothetical protein [Halorhabdus rudnickae]